MGEGHYTGIIGIVKAEDSDPSTCNCTMSSPPIENQLRQTVPKGVIHSVTQPISWGKSTRREVDAA